MFGRHHYDVAEERDCLGDAGSATCAAFTLAWARWNISGEAFTAVGRELLGLELGHLTIPSRS
jgi:hypothetical protein